MGEAEFEQKALVKAVDGALAEQATAMSVATPGGRFQVRWDEGGSATALGRLPSPSSRAAWAPQLITAG